MITENYVSLEIFKLLKDKGFDYRGFDYIDFGGEVMRQDRPTHQLAMKWLREEKGVYIEIRRSVNTFLFGAIIRNDDEDNFYQMPRNLDSYEQAVEAALKYSLENLI